MSSSFDKTMLTDWVIIGALWAASEPAAKGLNKLQNMFRARTEHSIVKFEKTLAWALSQAFTGLAKILMVLYFSDLTVSVDRSVGLGLQQPIARLTTAGLQIVHDEQPLSIGLQH